MTLQDYIGKINTRFKTGISREHSYRADLQNLLENLVTGILVTNEPARVACGAPDYIITKKNIPVGYIEAKDVGSDLDNKTYKEQFDRYRKSLNNLIITDYLTFQLYRDASLVSTISIGKIQGNKVTGNPENYDKFVNFIKDFCSHEGQTIKSAAKLSKMMAAKARLLADVIEKALTPEENTSKVNEPAYYNLFDQYKSFQEILIHDITVKSFADIYAQTIAYGMFAARLNDPSIESFSRQEAAMLIPKSNPFLRKLFQYIAGYDLDDRIKWIVDALADIFRATNVSELLKDFGKATQQNDPMIHFYETFLAEYDPALRKSRGVFYTPEPVVNFIVRAVDDILKTEFNLPKGLADTSKIKIKVDVQGKKAEEEVHKVQILDPAAGTGTFLAEVVKQIYKNFEGQQGVWNNYVEEHLIPRLNGFEILMASYAMAHLKLEMLLKETGFSPKKDQRFRIYLTNSLEEFHPDTGTLWANWLSTEANEANHIKRDTPVMVVLGNPPYSVSSSNKSPWIEKLCADYKKDLNEKNIQPLSDDYIKFIRFGEYLIEKNGEGILAFISNNSFIDGIIHRQMRKHLLQTFDKIYILDLHGNAKKKETAPDGSKDENVFDIMQGVSINIFVKNNNKKKNNLAEVLHFELFGKREEKYTYLKNPFNSVSWKLINKIQNYLFFVKKEFKYKNKYENGFLVSDIFTYYNAGLATEFDEMAIQDTRENAVNLYKNLKDLPLDSILIKYKIKNNKIIKLKKAINDVSQNRTLITEINYRPFDNKFTLYTGNSNGFMGRPRNKIMEHLLKNNIALLICRQQTTYDFQHIFITKLISERCSVSLQTGEVNYIFPMYLYLKSKPNNNKEKKLRTPNLNPEIINQISQNLNLTFTNEKEETKGTFAPIDVLDYIYAVLHSPTYRKKYKEFLKIDFPRVPYPKDKKTFWKLVKFGGELRQIHLLESPIVEKRITTFPVTGSNIVEKVRYEDGKVWINKEQYFDKVPEISWSFYIGGYQPAQKWLKDRKGRALSFEDIIHYQKIIVALFQTDRIMKEIDKIEVE